MTSVLIILRQLITMFLYMGIGAVLFRKGFVTREGSRSMANVLLYAVMPSVVVQSFCVERTPEKTHALLVSVGVAAVLMLLSMLLARLLCRDPLDVFGVTFANAGFMGFPLVTAVLGGDAIFYATGFVALVNVLQWTYGQLLISGDRRYCDPRDLIKNPLILSVLVGVLIFFLQPPIPALVQTTLAGLSALNGPLAMLVLGVYLAQTDLRKLFTTPHLYRVSAVRLVVIPLLSVLLLRLLPAEYDAIRATLAIVVSAPVGSNVAVYAQRLDKDYTYAVQIVCLCTILSLLTMPLMLLLI